MIRIRGGDRAILFNATCIRRRLDGIGNYTIEFLKAWLTTTESGATGLAVAGGKVAAPYFEAEERLDRNHTLGSPVPPQRGYLNICARADVLLFTSQEARVIRLRSRTIPDLRLAKVHVSLGFDQNLSTDSSIGAPIGVAIAAQSRALAYAGTMTSASHGSLTWRPKKSGNRC